MKYDRTLKSLFHTLPQRLLTLLTGQEALELLPVEFPSVKSRVPDLVARLCDGTIFHMELQATNPDNMPERMLEYRTLLRVRYPHARILQLVLYVGPGRPDFQMEIVEENLTFRYTVMNIGDIDCRLMLDSPCLEENLLAILCRLEDGRRTIQAILTRIAALPAKARADALEKLMILAGLRKLEVAIKEEVTAMAITVDVMENAFLRDIFNRGETEGLQKGRQEGLREGQMRTLRSLLEWRFGQTPDWVASNLAKADVESLEQWTKNLFNAGSLEEVFQSRNPPPR
ncbi:MAG: Rpn family recombination-promoting nuclease/putative transposase [Magnetococcales bacterium]|nr:Rpn family recombination-promoting nuclease/putative transposase [Magnetococcales bacterium]